jgi:2-methylcitrate dehydratase
VTRGTYDGLAEEVRSVLKAQVLDALGCAIGALDGEPMVALRAQLEDSGGNP